MPVTMIKVPEWGLYYYYIKGYCTSAELVKVVGEAAQEPLERAVAIFDILSGDLDMEWEDIKQLISINKDLYQNKNITTRAAILTKNRSIEIVVKSFGLLTSDEQSELQVFSSLTEGLAWVKLAEHEQEIQGMLDKVEG